MLLSAIVVIAALLGIAQLVLPGVAAKAMKDRIARYGEVDSVSVSALPAIELLWGEADSASARASALSMRVGALVGLLMQARSIDELTVNVKRLELSDPGFGLGAMKLEDAKLRKQGKSLLGSAILTEHALASALPAGVKATLVPGGGFATGVEGSEGFGVEVRGSLLGLSAGASASVQAEAGKLVLRPTAPAIATFAKVTVLADPRIEVLSVAARPAAGSEAAAARGWLVTLKARLR